MAILFKLKVIEDNKKKINAFFERGFGELNKDYLTLAPVEAIYLVEKEKLIVKDVKKGRKKLKFVDLIKHFRNNDKEIIKKYFIYKDLRQKGYVVRTGLKYGAYFRVYEKGVRVGEGHSHWLVHPFPEEGRTSIYEIARAVRLAHSVRKKMIWAIVDSEGDITYYKFERIVP